MYKERDQARQAATFKVLETLNVDSHAYDKAGMFYLKQPENLQLMNEINQQFERTEHQRIVSNDFEPFSKEKTLEYLDKTQMGMIERLAKASIDLQFGRITMQ